LKRTGASAGLSELSRRYNRGPSTQNASATTSTMVRLPKMTENERKLLLENDGCLKCQRFFAGHRSNNCQNRFLNASSYRTLSMEDVNAARHRTSKTVASITAAASPTVEATAHHVAAVMPPNKSSVLDLSGSDLSKDSDDDVSVNPHADCPIPFMVPHYKWDCLVSNKTTGEPITLQSLLDDGSHMVLIDDIVARGLGLCRRCLPKLIPIELALSPSNRTEAAKTVLTEWVKLKPRDVNDQWTSRTVRTVVAPSLCTDLILGLPFLVANKLVMDYEERTCKDKKSGFDI
jgi:hypothetical protein